jgi:(2Fe-2S) ferredoxin
MGDANLINTETELYQKVDAEQIQRVARELFRKENCSELFYHAKL